MAEREFQHLFETVFVATVEYFRQVSLITLLHAQLNYKGTTSVSKATEIKHRSRSQDGGSGVTNN